MTSVLREHPDRFAQAACGLPDCGAPLYFERTETSAIYLSDTAAEVAAPGGDTSHWQVVCQAGHTVLVPVDTAADSYTFGDCALHDEGEQHDRSCDDLARLRLVVDDAPAQVQR